MIAIWLLGALTALTVAIHMAKPRGEPRPMSSARFFAILPPPRRDQVRPRLTFPLRSWTFYARLLVMALLLAALFQLQTRLIPPARAIGAWLLLDTSGSMTTRQGDGARAAAALAGLSRTLAATQAAARHAGVCWRLSAFDQERRDVASTSDAAAVQSAARSLAPRALGTDLGLVQAAQAAVGQPDGGATRCNITHLIVISDQPAPAWAEQGQPPIIWLDVGRPVSNAGLTALDAVRDPLTGNVLAISVQVTAFGRPPADAQLTIQAPDGTTSMQAAAWQPDGTWHVSFKPTGPGDYTLRLLPDDAYALDNQAIIRVSPLSALIVDWQLEDHSLPDELGWLIASPGQFRVVPQDARLNKTPTLIVGDGYSMSGAGPVEVRDFVEGHMLLSDLNLDVAESLGIRGAPLPTGFRPVLRGNDDLAWLAVRDDPPAAFVPGLPTGTDDDLGRFSETAFFNAVRWLLQRQPLQPLYTLTTPDQPEPLGNHLALHPDESNTAREPRSAGSLAGLQPAAAVGSPAAGWPWLVLGAAIVFLVERTAVAWKGVRWR